MKNEFNLSDYIRGDIISEALDTEFIRVRDVKEFIRILKEELVQENVWDEESMGIIENKIDKLAGDKLR